MALFGLDPGYEPDSDYVPVRARKAETLHEMLEDMLYSEWETLVAMNKARPAWLIEICRELQLFCGDLLREEALLTLRQTLQTYKKACAEQDDQAKPNVDQPASVLSSPTSINETNVGRNAAFNPMTTGQSNRDTLASPPRDNDQRSWSSKSSEGHVGGEPSSEKQAKGRTRQKLVMHTHTSHSNHSD